MVSSTNILPSTLSSTRHGEASAPTQMAYNPARRTFQLSVSVDLNPAWLAMTMSMENTPQHAIEFASGRSLRARLLNASAILSRVSILTLFILVATGNITNSLLLKYGFEEQAAHIGKHATFIEMMNGTAARPFVYRSITARLDYWVATEIVHKWPWTANAADGMALHRYYFADVKASEWTSQIATAYTLMYFVIVVSTALGLFFVVRIARIRGLSYGRALAFICAFSFIFPLLFQRSVLFYDFIEFAGVFGACYFFLEDWMIRCTLVIALFSFVKETFFLVPVGLVFLHKDGVPRKETLHMVCIAARNLSSWSAFHHAGL